MELKGKRRTSDTERIIMVLVGAPESPECLLNRDVRTLITKWMKNHITANKVYMTSVVKCCREGNPTKVMVKCCEDRLRQELTDIQPDVIVCLGKAAATPFNITGKAKELYNRVFTIKPIAIPRKAGEDPNEPLKHTRESKLIITHSPSDIADDIKVWSSVESAFRQAERFSKDSEIKLPENYYLCESPAEFEEWAERHMTNPTLKKIIHAFDIETNGRELHPKTEFDAQFPPKLRCLSFSWAKGMALCVPFEDDPEGYYPILKKLMESDISWCGHNVAFDIFFLKIVNDIHVKRLVGDTMLMASMLNPGKGKFGYGLKPLSAEFTDLGGYETDMKGTEDQLDDKGRKLKTKWEIADMATIAPYNCADSDATLQIFHIFFNTLKERNMLVGHWVMTNALFPLAKMEHHGFLVNTEWVDDARKKLEELVVFFDKELTRLCGNKHFDWNSPVELAHVLYTVLGYKPPSLNAFQKFSASKDEDNADTEHPTNDDALSILNTEFTQTMRKYRKTEKLLSTYFNGYLKNIGLDKRLRADFVLVGTVTGRLSSSGDANLQNIPSAMSKTAPGYQELHEFKVKKAFVARPGWCIVNADQSQLELRIAGACSGEERFIKSYKNKIDMHSRNANVSFSLDISVKVWENEAKELGLVPGSEDFQVYVERKLCQYIKHNFPDERQAAKSVSFGILYGMSQWGLAKDLNDKGRDAGSRRIWTPEECKGLISRFKEGYPTLIAWQTDLIRFARKHGYTYTCFGRRRYLPGIKSDKWKLKSDAERQAINTPVQSAGSDFMMAGVVNMDQNLDHDKFRFCATVHDSVVCEVREGYLDEFVQIAKGCLEEPRINGRVIPLCEVMPFVAEFEAGDTYGTLNEYKI